MKKVLLALVIVVLLVPLAVWALFKPVRVVAPQWSGPVSCISPQICIEDESRYRQASVLYEETLHAVAGVAGAFRDNPRVIFCVTQTCFRAFGFDKAAARAVGRSGIVIGPRGWEAHYLRHEMIHHRQAEELGVFSPWLKPAWFVEGMAYALSDDPRQLLSEPWQRYRHDFRIWYGTVGKDRLWEAAGEL